MEVETKKALTDNPNGGGAVIEDDDSVSHNSSIIVYSDSGNMSLGGATCQRCNDSFRMDEQIVNCNGQVWHTHCFVCAQCFQVFPEGRFFEFESRKYCEHDFCVLFAPSCKKCEEFISGRVIKAMNASWHPECFCCLICERILADEGFVKNQGRALCKECNEMEKAKGLGKYVCFKCH